jgi:hypothetical protein
MNPIRASTYDEFSFNSTTMQDSVQLTDRRRGRDGYSEPHGRPIDSELRKWLLDSLDVAGHRHIEGLRNLHRQSFESNRLV